MVIESYLDSVFVIMDTPTLAAEESYIPEEFASAEESYNPEEPSIPVKPSNRMGFLLGREVARRKLEEAIKDKSDIFTLEFYRSISFDPDIDSPMSLEDVYKLATKHKNQDYIEYLQPFLNPTCVICTNPTTEHNVSMCSCAIICDECRIRMHR